MARHELEEFLPKLLDLWKDNLLSALFEEQVKIVVCNFLSLSKFLFSTKEYLWGN